MSRYKTSRKHIAQKQESQVRQTRNKRVFVTTSILIAVLAIVWLTYEYGIKEDFVPEVTGAPAARVDRTTVDHGDVPVNQFIESKFEVTNVGDELLMFYNTPRAKVIQGCCPPAVEISKMELKPGETATVSMNYTMHEGMDGLHELAIELRTNDPEQPEIILTAFSNWD